MSRFQIRDLYGILEIQSRSPRSESIDPNLEIGQVTSDSRRCSPRALFFAHKGQSSNGHDYIAQAIRAGVSLVIGEYPAIQFKDIPYLQVSDAREAYARAAKKLYGNPTREMKVIGVTGTSGKTTTAHLIESILQAAGEKVGLIGTIEYRWPGVSIPSTHTTPDARELQEMIAKMKADLCTAVVMEVSSHGLRQRRVCGVDFDAAVFTNLSPEHLDYHQDMEDYFSAKQLLFTEYFHDSISEGKNPVAVINADHEYGRRLLSQPPEEGKFISFGISRECQVRPEGLISEIDGTRFRVGELQMESALVGAFNVENLLAAVAVGLGLGVSPQAIEQGVRNLPGVPGRLEEVQNDRGLHVLVDYAHKPDALEKVLRTLRVLADQKGARLITVMGCGGDRDRLKRPVMGRLTTEYSDLGVITSDNPRTEDPRAIIEEIVAGIRRKERILVEPDRRNAIGLGIQNAKPGDIVLIAGKGHETYQIIGTQKSDFDDRLIARAFLGQ